MSKDNIASDGSFNGFVELESGTYDFIFYLSLVLSIVFLMIIFKINVQMKIDGNKDSNGSIQMQLAYLIGVMGILIYVLHGEVTKFIFFSIIASIGILKTFPKKD